MCISWHGIFTTFVAAESEEGAKHISTGKILEFSLNNLKESLFKTKQRNDQLTFENAALRNDIQYFKRMLENLSLKKTGLSGGSSEYHYQKDQMILPAIDLSEREGRTQELLAIFKKDVLALQKEIQLLDNQLDQGDFISQKRALMGQKEENLENISKIEKRLKYLDKNSSDSQKTIEELEREKDELERKLAILQDRAGGY
jgi:chromosome segregation ATPase